MSLATRLEDRFGIHPNEAHRLGAILTHYTPELFRKNYPTQANLMRVSAGLYVGLSGKTFFIVKYGNFVFPETWHVYHAKSLAAVASLTTLQAVRQATVKPLFRKMLRDAKYPLNRVIYEDSYRAMRMFCIGKTDYRTDYTLKAIARQATLGDHESFIELKAAMNFCEAEHIPFEEFIWELSKWLASE